MQLPIVSTAPAVRDHAAAFRDLFDNRCQFDHFQHYLTGLMVLPNKSMSNIARCVLESPDKTNLSRFFSEAPWAAEEINDRRVRAYPKTPEARKQMKAQAKWSMAK
jgi:SRSO17 transposase